MECNRYVTKNPHKSVYCTSHHSNKNVMEHQPQVLLQIVKDDNSKIFNRKKYNIIYLLMLY